MLTLVPVDVLVKVTVDPRHGVRGAAVKLAARPQPARLTASVFVVPTHDEEFVSVTVIFPLVVPKVTVI